MVRYSFSRSIPLKFERKLCRHKQRFGKIDTTVVLNKDETLLWSGLQWHWRCHSNKMTPLPISHATVFLSTGNCSFKIVYWSFFLQQPPQCSWSLSDICKSDMEIFWEEVFMVRNTVKNGESWCLMVIYTKQSTFDVQFHLIVVTIFLRTVPTIATVHIFCECLGSRTRCERNAQHTGHTD